MPILAAKKEQPAIRKTGLATGMGVIFGFQIWWLAEFAMAMSIPWYGSAWVVFSQVLLGFSIGRFDTAQWWRRGALFGLMAGLPSAFGAQALGLNWVAYGAASFAFSLSTGLLVAFLADALFPREVVIADPEPLRCDRPRESAADPKVEPFPAQPVQQRLTRAKDTLDQLAAERERRGDSRYGKAAEDRIVWNELIELELQDIDEQVSRLCGPVTPAPSDL